MSTDFLFRETVWFWILFSCSGDEQNTRMVVHQNDFLDETLPLGVGLYLPYILYMWITLVYRDFHIADLMKCHYIFSLWFHWNNQWLVHHAGVNFSGMYVLPGRGQQQLHCRISASMNKRTFCWCYWGMTHRVLQSISQERPAKPKHISMGILHPVNGALPDLKRFKQVPSLKKTEIMLGPWQLRFH